MLTECGVDLLHWSLIVLVSKLCLINCSNPNTTHLESDEYIDYRSRFNSFFSGDKILKRCTSWHSLAAATETEFFVYNKDKWQGVYQYDDILMLVNRDLMNLIPLLQKLKLMKKKVILAYHEGIQDLTRYPEKYLQLKQLVEQHASGYYNVIFQYHPFFQSFINKPVVSFGHGAPIEWQHSFKKDIKDRKGILIATRSLRNDFLTRNTFIAIASLCKSFPEETITYLNEDGIQGKDYIAQFGFQNLFIIDGALPYEEWLNLISTHKLIAHFDQSQNLGQVCADGAMVDVLSVGSTTGNATLTLTDNHDLDYFLKDVKYWLNAKVKDQLFYLNLLKEQICFDATKKKMIEMFELIRKN